MSFRKRPLLAFVAWAELDHIARRATATIRRWMLDVPMFFFIRLSVAVALWAT